MGTKKNKDQEKEVVEIQILTEEQVDALPKEAVKTVKALKGTLPQAQLEIFIPVVQKYMELREKASKLKLEKDEDGSIKKDAIEAYKEVKKEQRAFNGELKREIKKIKDPLNAIKNDVITVEKTFQKESDKIKDAALKEFEEYEEEIARKKREAEEKKNAAMRAEIEKANEEAEQLRRQTMKTQVINDLKYKEIMEGITGRANEAVANSNERSLDLLKQELINTAWEDIRDKYDTSMVEEETLKQIQNQYHTAKTNAQQLIQDKLNQYEMERENALEKARKESQELPSGRNEDLNPTDPNASMGVAPPKPEPSLNIELKERSDEDMVAYIKNHIAAMELALDWRMEHKGVTPILAELKMKFNQFNS